eukprot:ANDGO_08142.mRNA.1 hypothetical protein Gasu_37920
MMRSALWISRQARTRRSLWICAVSTFAFMYFASLSMSASSLASNTGVRSSSDNINLNAEEDVFLRSRRFKDHQKEQSPSPNPEPRIKPAKLPPVSQNSTGEVTERMPLDPKKLDKDSVKREKEKVVIHEHVEEEDVRQSSTSYSALFSYIPLDPSIRIIRDYTTGCPSAKDGDGTEKQTKTSAQQMPVTRFPICILSAPRHSVEYLSATIRSFIKAASDVYPLYVFVTDPHAGVTNSMVDIDEMCAAASASSEATTTAAAPSSASSTSSTTTSPYATPPIVFYTRSDAARPVLKPVKKTLGDSDERIAWRSKEAQDYAFALQTCELFGSDEHQFVTIVQDDVHFSRKGMHSLETSLQEHAEKNGEKWLAVSLWDQHQSISFGPTRMDGAVAKTYNAVYAPLLYEYIYARYDESPVDWQISNFAKEHDASITVRTPNPVEHMGKASSLKGQMRDQKSATYQLNGDVEAWESQP